MKLYYFKKISSTNEKSKGLAEKGISNAVIVANEQTRGRGRFKRKWVSSEGGLYFSVLLNEKDINKVKYLTFIAAISVVKAVERITGLKTKIKWPNDVHINKKKLCGILTESFFGKKNYVVVGVGINVNQGEFPKEIKDIAISLKSQLGRQVDKNRILKQFLKEFDILYSQYKNKKYEKILSEWKRYCDTVGKNIKVVTLKKEFYGKAVEVDSDCNLILKLKDGKIKKIVEGDILVLGQ